MGIEQTIERVRVYRRETGVSRSAFARQAGLGPNALSAMDRPDWSPNADTLRKLEALIPSDWRPNGSADAA
jgi:transcriptional regulator with XRE-family HTH domain